MWDENIARIAENVISSMKKKKIDYSKAKEGLEKKVSVAKSLSMEVFDLVLYSNIVPDNVVIAIFLENLHIKENLFCKNYNYGAVVCGKYRETETATMLVLSEKFDENHEKFTHFVEIDLDDKLFDRIDYKDRIHEGNIVESDGKKHVVSFTLIDGTVKEETFTYEKNLYQKAN